MSAPTRPRRTARRHARSLALSLGLSLLVAALPASADSCRDWIREHFDWKSEVARRYLGGAPTPALDAAVFELLQREAYLSSCELPVRDARRRLVGWRLVDHTPDDYPRLVVASLVASAGTELDVERLFVPARAEAPPPRRPVVRSVGRNPNARRR